MKESMPYYQQGDVLIKKTNKIPEEAIPQDHVILARGESTGHMHRISDPRKATLMMLAGILYLRVLAENCELIHEEHGPIILPTGDYQIDTVKEYDHLAEEVRRVQD